MIDTTYKSLFWDSEFETISELSTFRKQIKTFKHDQALKILKRFSDFTPPQTRFRPGPVNGRNNNSKGLFTTVLSLETISSLDNECIEYEKKNPDIKWLGLSLDEGLLDYTLYLFNNLYSEVTSSKKDHGSIAIITTLLKYKKYLRNLNKIRKHNGQSKIEFYKDIYQSKKFETTKDKASFLLRRTLNSLSKKVSSINLSVDPFYLNRSIQFLDYWKRDIFYLFSDIFSNIKMQDLSELEIKIEGYYSLHKENHLNFENELFKDFFETVYFLGKYELYRQLSLKASGDYGQYDVKRLIYAVLTVSYNNKFSNPFVITKALNTIFEDQKKNKSSIWPTGQLLQFCDDSNISVSTIECINDLLDCNSLQTYMQTHFSSVKRIFDFYAITMRLKIENDLRVPVGWFPPDQRGKNITGSETAFVLCFIKKFCNFLSRIIKIKAKQEFAQNYRVPKITWKRIYDATGVKLKLEEYIVNPRSNNEKYASSAMLFGPPGTGKSTYASALAGKLEMDYLELTLGDFFSGGENEILTRINMMFENMTHLENTVVFIDEIDDLVQKRQEIPQFYDPRSLYVNTLLPRFQELNSKKNVILLMATNNPQNIDEAIQRIGRIDLIIPVGTLSPFGRLKLLYDRTNKIGIRIALDDMKSLREQVGKYISTSYLYNFNELDHMMSKVENIDASIINRIKEFIKIQERAKKNEKYEEFVKNLEEDQFKGIRPPCKGECTEFAPTFVENYITLFHCFYILKTEKDRNPNQIIKFLKNTIEEIKRDISEVLERRSIDNEEYSKIYNLLPFITAINELPQEIANEFISFMALLKEYKKEVFL